MCGRFLLYSSTEVLERTFGLDLGDRRPNVAPRYSIAPTQDVAVVGVNGARRGLARMSWGLLPSWAKDRKLGAKMINARGETVHEKPAFRAAFRARRCLIPADGFYEWQPGDTGKVPWLLTPSADGPMAFGGLFERWRDPEGSDVWSCTIVTTEASADIAHLHHRMPLILDAGSWETWLSGSVEGTRGLIVPAPSRTLHARPADKRVNNIRIDEAALIAPLPEHSAPLSAR